MDKEQFYEDFVNVHLVKLDELIKELHIAYLTRNALYNNLLDHEDAISSSGINFNLIIDIVLKDIVHSPPDLSKLDIGDKTKTKVIKYTINSLFYTACQRIPTLIKQIKFTQVLSRIPRDIYYNLQETINWNISNSILKGDFYVEIT